MTARETERREAWRKEMERRRQEFDAWLKECEGQPTPQGGDDVPT